MNFYTVEKTTLTKKDLRLSNQARVKCHQHQKLVMQKM